MTGQDIVNSSFRILGVLDSQETPSVSESTDALARLTDMLDSWNTERLNIPCVVSSTVALTSGTAQYTLGTRPMKLEAINVAFTSGSGQIHHAPVELIDVAAWNAIPFKSTGAPDPEKAYYDKGFPTAKLNLYPIPTFAGARTLELFTWQLLNNFIDLTTDVVFPPAYARAIRYNLAIELAGEFAAVPTDAVIEIAKESKAAIRMLNVSLAGQEPDSGPINAIPQG